MNTGNKNWTYFLKIKYFKNQSLMLKKDFERQNFAIFENVVHNFGRSDDDII